MLLAGKRALVIGAGAGSGAAIAAALAGAGARVCAADAHATGDTPPGEDGFAAQVDPLDAASMAALAYEVFDRFGDLDILVNAMAPAPVHRPLDTMPDGEFDRLLALHARCIYLSARHFIPPMKARNAGIVLNLSGIAGLSPRPRGVWQGAAKAWVIAATQGMAVELGPHNIRVNAIVPAGDESPAVPGFMGGARANDRAQSLAAVPLGRFATPEDVGAAAVFLCSDAASFITGVALPVDGGRRI